MNPISTKNQPASRVTALLLSIRPEHAHRIFAGSKHYELRKIVPAAKFGRVFLYETGGTGIVGWFDVDRMIKHDIARLWKTVGAAATSRDRFDRYFASAREGYAIGVSNPQRFATPVSIKQLNGDRFRLQPPQSFIVLEPGQPLWSLLESERQKTLKSAFPKSVALKRITTPQRATYTSLVTKHVGANYQEIDRTFAQANLRIHDLGFDPAGFFTTKKEVLGVYNDRNNCIGFTTLTYKSGGCVKTGPTILLQRYRSKGYGQATRKAIEQHVLRSEARKLYCTCPETSEETIRYLLASGMRIEAHLANHYSTNHNELVFGKLLVTDDTSFPVVGATQPIPCGIVDPDRVNRRVLVQDFKEMFERIWPAVSDGFVARLLKEALDEKATEHHQKPKRLICVGTVERIFAAVVLLPKRGGAVKGLMLRKTNDRNAFREIVEESMEMTRHLGGRKLYFLHPVNDAETLLLLKGQGFQAEGLLLAPYVPGQDVTVMTRFV